MSEPKKSKNTRGKVRAKAGGERKRKEDGPEESVEVQETASMPIENNDNPPDNRPAQTVAPKVETRSQRDDDDYDDRDDRDDRDVRRDEDYDDHDDDYDDRREADRRPAPPRREELRQPLGPADDYQFQVTFDRQTRRYLGTAVEFPEIRITSNNPEAALDEIRMAVEDHIEFVRRRGDAIPEPLGTKTYPQMLSVPMSQGLFRKLDLLSRQEKVSIDKLVAELIAGAVEKRYEPAPRQGGNQNRQPQHNSGNHSGNRNDGNHGGGNRRGGGGRHGGGGHRGGRNSEMMENRESFMEYVRNLEKGGGGWKKR